LEKVSAENLLSKFSAESFKYFYRPKTSFWAMGNVIRFAENAEVKNLLQQKIRFQPLIHSQFCAENSFSADTSLLLSFKERSGISKGKAL
jgi:hypothetical protein